MDFISNLKSVSFVYDFDNDQEIRVLTRKQKFFCYLILPIGIFELIKTVFHAYVNDNMFRFYMCDYIFTLNKDQFLFNVSFAVMFSFMIRLYLYLLCNEHNLSKFQWLQFLKIQDLRTLVKTHFFLPEEAESYLVTINAYIKTVKPSNLIYFVASTGMIGRGLLIAYREIPIYWFLFSSLTNAISFLLFLNTSYFIYNYFVTIYFTSCVFTQKSLRSLSNHYSPFVLGQLKQDKVNQFSKQNLAQFNYLIKMFKYGQSNFNYTFSFCTGVLTICYMYG